MTLETVITLAAFAMTILFGLWGMWRWLEHKIDKLRDTVDVNGNRISRLEAVVCKDCKD